MQSSLADHLHPWHDFYVLVGTASATLVGLMFVASSIGANVFNQEHRTAMKAFLSPTVVHFSAALFVCVLAVIPTHTWLTLGGLLVVVGVAGVTYAGRIWIAFFVSRSFEVDMVDRLFYALVPVLGYLLVLVSAALLFLQSAASEAVIAAGLVTLLLAGIRNAWDMMIWIVIRTPTLEAPSRQTNG